ncbi:MAG: adenylate/guanylate cyclase domain-containing protein [Treponema sp.]|nr:adenylate/guanylate cyclase domain-containing protein [Treponema sp.]
MPLKREKVKHQKNYLIISVGACLVSCLLFFTTLDNKLFDVFLRFLPPLTESEKVFVLALDDDSMELAGGFPFRREVMADIVILLKELGVEQIVFDLSYLDESARRFDPYYAVNSFARHFDSDYISLDEAISVIPMIGRDVDEYFAKTLAFSGCSWLTLTMFSADLYDNADNIPTNKEIDSFLAQYISADGVTGKGDTKTPVAVNVLPAIQKLLGNAKGAGIVNALPDADGLRRRVHLLWKYQDNYYKQLSLAAIQEKLGYNTVEVSNRAITLNMDKGGILRIPRAQDGSVLIRWPQKLFKDYNWMSLVPLIHYTMIVEPSFAENIAVMRDSGFFYCWEGGLTPWDWYSIAEEIKNEAFENNSAAEQEWLLAKKEFFNTSKEFLYNGYEDIILADVGDDYYIAEFVRDIFNVCRSEFERLAAIREEVAVLEGSFSIIGSDATSMTDHSIVAFEENYPNVGSYAVIANMLLAGDFVVDSPWFISLIIALIFSLLIGFFVSHFDTHFSVITGITGITLLCASFAVFFLASRIYLGLAVPLASVILSFITIMVSKFLTASHEKTFLHNAFSRYLAPEVISEIINDPSKLNLGGEKREMTAMFTDIQGFSTISEQLDPVHLVKLLNRYLTLMSNIIMENVGTIDKYEGDAIIAFFGAPVFRADHAVLTCRSAVAMKMAERELNKTVVEEGLSPVPLFTRIGINTGEMVVGNMGAENKMDYTIMGNAVNLAARLEGVNKQYRTGGILISEYTKDKIGDEFLLRRLDRVRVVGINTPLRLYEILGMKNEDTAVDIWESAIDLFETREFAQAQKLFDSVKQMRSDDLVAGLYIERCEAFAKDPPPEEWDAVRNLTEK